MTEQHAFQGKLATYDSHEIVDDDFIDGIGDDELKVKCASLKLAGRIVGAASTLDKNLDDETLIEKISEMMERIALLRTVALDVLGTQRNKPGYPQIFNAMTTLMIDIVTEEWKWQQLGRTERFSSSVVSAIFQEAIAVYERQEIVSASSDFKLTWKLAVLKSSTTLHSLPNIFDYFQAEVGKMVGILVAQVSSEVNKYLPRLVSKRTGIEVQLTVIDRLFEVSTGLLCEIYKAQAKKDIERLRRMPELDRSLLIAQYESSGSMKYDHILEMHREGMVKIMETANALYQSSVNS